MIEHVVAFQGRPKLLSELDDVLREFVSGAAEQIPGVIDVVGGRNFNPGGAPYTHVIVIRFADRASLDAYNASSHHRDLAEQLPRLTFHGSVFDVNHASS